MKEMGTPFAVGYVIDEKTDEDESVFSDSSVDASLNECYEIVNEMYKKQNSSNSSEGDDNTSLSPSPPKKQVSPAVHWSFVLNNWTEDEYSNIVESDSSEVPVLVVNKEIGEEEGTPHLQGCLSFNSKKRPMSLGWSRRIHWYGVRTTSVIEP